MLSNIKAEMAKRNISTKEVSKKLGMCENTFRFKLTEKREFSLSELAKLAKMFNVSIDYLVSIRNETNEYKAS